MDNIMKYVYVIVDSELGESDSFVGVFDDKNYAIHTAKIRDQFLYERDVYRVTINQVDSLYKTDPVYSQKKEKRR